MSRLVLSVCAYSLAQVSGVLAAADTAKLPFEIHGFTSIGGFISGENEWLIEDSTDGSSEFWEFGVNITAQPLDRLRLGAQVFARDLGNYDNGRLQLDWIYADYRMSDPLGIQVGRVKIPYGLYNEVLDVDSARTPVFLAQAGYALRSRDLLISCDGVKAYGYTDMDAAGGLEYSAYVGYSDFSDKSGTARLFREQGFEENLELEMDYRYGGMLHWHTPLDGLGVRASLSNLVGFEISGSSPAFGTDNVIMLKDAPSIALSAEWETEKVTYAAEWNRTLTHGDLTIRAPAGVFGPDAVELMEFFDGDTIAFYLSADWRVRENLSLYGAIDVTSVSVDTLDDPEQSAWRYVVAARYDVLENVLLKAEFQFVDGQTGALSGANGSGKEDQWWVAAIKTTVDF